ncbi:MAG: hypothetical protein V5A43_01775 [Haloarculaceae archaeon]
MRGISTVLDVAVFLLLVSAAVATLTVPASPAPDTDVGSVASTLGTATADVEYRAAVVVELQNGTETTLSEVRRANGTVANLLADAAVSTATFEPADGAGEYEEYRRALANRTREILRWFDARTQVEAQWQPYTGAPLGGSLTVGPTPPDRDVMVATLDVPAPVASVQPATRRVASGGYEAVAAVVANATVRGLYPARRMALAVQSGGLDRGLAINRYRRLLAGLDLDVAGQLRGGAVAEVNRALVAGLTEVFARDMRQQFDSPAAAAAAVRAGRARLIVRGWEA